MNQAAIYALAREVRVEIGVPVELIVAFSEAACHARIGGTRQTCIVTSEHVARVIDANGNRQGYYTPGELGILRDAQGFYCYPDGV